MKKVVLIVTLMISFLTQANAQDQEEIPRITFGAEWSCTASFFTAYHFNYFSPDGYRYDQRGADGGATFNGEGLVHVGYNVNGKWNIALYTGFTGISAIHNAVPISFRATRLFKSDMRGDRWLAFADTGTGFSIKKEIQEMYALKLGGGYRYSLSRDTKLDLLASVRCTYTHPEIKFEHEPISNRWTNRNDAIVISATIGISVTF